MAFRRARLRTRHCWRPSRTFEQANKSFDAEVDKLEDSVANKRLNELKGDSAKKYEYPVVDTGIKSKNIVQLREAHRILANQSRGSATTD